MLKTHCLTKVPASTQRCACCVLKRTQQPGSDDLGICEFYDPQSGLWHVRFCNGLQRLAPQQLIRLGLGILLIVVMPDIATLARCIQNQCAIWRVLSSTSWMNRMKPVLYI